MGKKRDLLRRHLLEEAEADAADVVYDPSVMKTEGEIEAEERAAFDALFRGNAGAVQALLDGLDEPAARGTDPAAGSQAGEGDGAADATAAAVILDIPELGAVRVRDVLLEYDTPALRTVVDAAGALYLVLEVALHARTGSFLVARVDEDALERIERGVTPLRQAFTACPDGFVRRWTCFYAGGPAVAVRVPCAEIPERDLPTADLCLG